MPYFGMGYGMEGMTGNEGDGQGGDDEQSEKKRRKKADGWGRPAAHEVAATEGDEPEAVDVPIFLEKAVEENIPVPKALIRKVIGKQAQTIIEIRQKSGVFKLDARDQTEDPVQVKVAGTQEAVDKAKQLIHELLESTKRVNDDAEYVEIPKAKIGMVIGLKGAQINEIQQQTGTKIDIDFENDPCKAFIKGPSEAVQQAKQVLLTITMQVEDETSEYLDLPKAVSGVLLGGQGQKVRDLQEATGARIDVDKTGLNCRIRLSGPAEAIAKAKRTIYVETEGMMQPQQMQWQSAMSQNPNAPPMNALPEVKAMDFPMSIEESIARAKAAAAAVARQGDNPNLPSTTSGPVTTAGFSMDPVDMNSMASSDVDPYAMRMHAIPVPPGMAGKVIGKGGSTLRSLEAMSGCQLSFDHDKSSMMVTGIPDAIQTVEAEMQKLLQSSWNHGAPMQPPGMMNNMGGGMKGGGGMMGPGLPGLAHLRNPGGPGQMGGNMGYQARPNMMGGNMMGGDMGGNNWGGNNKGDWGGNNKGGWGGNKGGWGGKGGW